MLFKTADYMIQTKADLCVMNHTILNCGLYDTNKGGCVCSVPHFLKAWIL